MAGRADVHVHLFFNGSGLESIAASADNSAFAVCGMYIFLHYYNPSLLKVTTYIITQDRGNASIKKGILSGFYNIFQKAVALLSHLHSYRLKSDTPLDL